MLFKAIASFSFQKTGNEVDVNNMQRELNLKQRQVF